MAVSPGSAVSLNHISLRRRLGFFGSDSLMTSYGNTRAVGESTTGTQPATIFSSPSCCAREAPWQYYTHQFASLAAMICDYAAVWGRLQPAAGLSPPPSPACAPTFV